MGEIVTVFHGTSLNRAKQIIANRCIKATDDDNIRNKGTTKGYVYVTKRICDALDFSIRPELGEDCNTFVVFLIEVKEDELLPDKDEGKWSSTLSDGGLVDCFRIQRDLVFNNDVKAVFFKQMKNNKSAGAFMQAVQYGDIDIKDNEWRVLWHA